jgi:hypothetical protein
MVSIGIQILSLKPANIVFSDGKEGDWKWGHGNDASLNVPGRYLQQISPGLVEEHGDALPGSIAYGFQSSELRDLAAKMFQSLMAEDICGLIETLLTENFPYKIEGAQLRNG